MADIKRDPGAVTVLVVAQALEAAGPSWQRIIANYTGVGQEWALPNRMINVPGGEKPSTWAARTFMVQQRVGAALGTITVLGASATDGQYPGRGYR